jgi:hypothetical protein
MVRFSAGNEEIGALLRFLRRRVPGERVYFAPLPEAERRHASRLFRRTERPLIQRLSADRSGAMWGIFSTADEAPPGQFAPPLLLLHLGAANVFGRREGLLEARDEIAGDPPDYTRRCRLARDLAVRCARRVRHRGTPEKGQWTLPF